jgi:hypothetical protein
MRIKFNDKIYRLKEIESGVDSLMELVEESKYNDGDFLHSDWNGENITIIYRKRNCIRLYYHASKSNRIGLDFDKEGFWPDGGDFRLATESEKKELIDALAEVGKRWNAEKKCIEDIPKRKFKAGDKVKIKDGISSETHLHIAPGFTSGMDEFIGKELIVKEYSSSGWVAFYGDDYEFQFEEDWLEPWIDEPKVGDWVAAWDADRETANVGILEALGGEGEVFKYVVNGFKWIIAVKWDGTIEHLEKIRKG